MTIHLGRPLPGASCGRNPGVSGEQPSNTPLFGLAPGGACRAGLSPGPLVSSYLTVSPLPAPPKRPLAVCSLLRFPSGFPGWPLASALLCGVRTFLDGVPRGLRTAPRRGPDAATWLASGSVPPGHGAKPPATRAMAACGRERDCRRPPAARPATPVERHPSNGAVRAALQNVAAQGRRRGLRRAPSDDVVPRVVAERCAVRRSGRPARPSPRRTRCSTRSSGSCAQRRRGRRRRRGASAGRSGR